MTARVQKFQGGRQKATYECHACHKLTRETGLEESGLDLCRACLTAAYAENAHSDYGHPHERTDCPICRKIVASYDAGQYPDHETGE